jgi:hypothetical protein
MLLQTNSYVVPKERRAEHNRVVRRFRQVLLRLGCDQFEVYEQVGTNWTSDQSSGRFVQIMRFRDRKHQIAIQTAERNDPVAQAVIAEFCEIINFPYQQQQGLFAIGYYTGILNSGKLLASPDSSDTAAPAAVPPQPAPVPIAASDEPMTMVVETADLVGVEADEEAQESTPIRNPFAESPIVAPVYSGGDRGSAQEPTSSTQSDGNGHPTAPTDGFLDDLGAGEIPDAMPTDEMPHSSAQDLDELIKQHFGGVGEGSDQNNSNALPGSGIGAVLDASLNGDDPDLDIALPAELLDPPESSSPHTSEPARHHGDEPGLG